MPDCQLCNQEFNDGICWRCRQALSTDNHRMCTTLLRIAARCQDWSTDLVRAAVADALGMTVAQLEEELS